MGLFSKLKSVLSKTRDGIAKKLNDLFAKNKLGEEFYTELEDILISADVSVKTTMEIVDEIRDIAIKEKCKDKEYVIDLLKKELFDSLDYAEKIEFTLLFPPLLYADEKTPVRGRNSFMLLSIDDINCSLTFESWLSILRALC